MMRRIIYMTIFLLFASSISYAQELEQLYANDTLEVYFHQDHHYWDPDYMDNGIRMNAFIDRFENLLENEVTKRISKVHIIAACSPEGLWEFNQRLSYNRAKEIRKVIKSYIELPDSVIVERAIGINWEGLRMMAENDTMLPYRDEVLYIIDNSPELYTKDDGQTLELRKVRLLWLRDGKPWSYMYKHYFPTLRSFNLQIVIEWENLKVIPPQLDLVEPKFVSQARAENIHTLAQSDTASVKTSRSFYMAAKSNMVYDALLVPNAGLEFYLGNGFSIEANYMHAWWKSDPHKWYWRAYGADLGIRKYFGRAAKEKPLTGHHIGAYGQVLTYDFELGNMGIIGGVPGGMLKDEPNYTVGIEYGYSIPVAKRLNIDFSIGVGYHWGVFYEYVPVDDCYVWQATKMRNYIGPTKVGISLVWLIGKGNTNNMKRGGRR